MAQCFGWSGGDHYLMSGFGNPVYIGYQTLYSYDRSAVGECQSYEGVMLSESEFAALGSSGGGGSDTWYINGEGGALVGGAILAVWVVAWAFRLLGRMINQS